MSPLPFSCDYVTSNQKNLIGQAKNPHYKSKSSIYMNNFKLKCVLSDCVLPNPLQVKFSSVRQQVGCLHRTCPEGGAAPTQQFNKLKADGKLAHVSRRWRKSNGNPAAGEPSGNIRHIKDDAPSSGS